MWCLKEISTKLASALAVDNWGTYSVILRCLEGIEIHRCLPIGGTFSAVMYWNARFISLCSFFFSIVEAREKEHDIKAKSGAVWLLSFLWHEARRCLLSFKPCWVCPELAGSGFSHWNTVPHPSYCFPLVLILQILLPMQFVCFLTTS